ncbi:MAG: hypothetical protein NNA18_11195 [Nitrospira sp.]|nr:hypothetical protein [Nitrospira sp.]
MSDEAWIEQALGEDDWQLTRDRRLVFLQASPQPTYPIASDWIEGQLHQLHKTSRSGSTSPTARGNRYCPGKSPDISVKRIARTESVLADSPAVWGWSGWRPMLRRVVAKRSSP